MTADRGVFAGLVVLVIAARSIELGVYAALGAALVEVPIALGLGAATVWVAEKVVLFVFNLRDPARPRRRFDRTIWRTLALWLAVGWPLFLLGSVPWNIR